MPRISMKVPEILVFSLDDAQRAKLRVSLVEKVAAVGNKFKKKLDISGAADIRAHANIGGFSNKHSVFAEIYMIPKACRTDEVIAEFGEAVAQAIRRAVKSYTNIDPGIDLPIRVVERKFYIERDDKPKKDTET